MADIYLGGIGAKFKKVAKSNYVKSEIAVNINSVRLHFNNKTAMDIDDLMRQHLPGRSRMSPSALLELPMFQQAQARLARMPSVLNGDKRIYRRLNEQQKRLIVYLRYASLDDFN